MADVTFKSCRVTRDCIMHDALVPWATLDMHHTAIGLEECGPLWLKTVIGHSWRRGSHMNMKFWSVCKQKLVLFVQAWRTWCKYGHHLTGLSRNSQKLAAGLESVRSKRTCLIEIRQGHEGFQIEWTRRSIVQKTMYLFSAELFCLLFWLVLFLDSYWVGANFNTNKSSPKLHSLWFGTVMYKLTQKDKAGCTMKNSFIHSDINMCPPYHN